MKIYIYSKSEKNARKEAKKIARRMKGRVHYNSGVYIVEYHAPAGESEPADLKDTGSPEPGLDNTAEVSK